MDREVAIVCAWCGRTTGYKRMEFFPGIEGLHTSTICPECMETHFAGLVSPLNILKTKEAEAHQKAITFGHHIAGRASCRSMKALQKLEHEWSETKQAVKNFEAQHDGEK